MQRINKTSSFCQYFNICRSFSQSYRLKNILSLVLFFQSGQSDVLEAVHVDFVVKHPYFTLRLDFVSPWLPHLIAEFGLQERISILLIFRPPLAFPRAGLTLEERWYLHFAVFAIHVVKVVWEFSGFILLNREDLLDTPVFVACAGRFRARAVFFFVVAGKMQTAHLMNKVVINLFH